MTDIRRRTILALFGATMLFAASAASAAELIRIGAYKAGTNPEVDNAVALYPHLDAFLAQKKDEPAVLSEGYDALAAILGGKGRA